LVVEEDRITGIATENDVVDGAGIVNAGFASHRSEHIKKNSRKVNLTSCPPRAE